MYSRRKVRDQETPTPIAKISVSLYFDRTVRLKHY